MPMPNLTRVQFSHQNFVDNSIHELLNKLNPFQKEILWNIEIISDIRDIISHHLVDIFNLYNENEFYP